MLLLFKDLPMPLPVNLKDTCQSLRWHDEKEDLEFLCSITLAYFSRRDSRARVVLESPCKVLMCNSLRCMPLTVLFSRMSFGFWHSQWHKQPRIINKTSKGFWAVMMAWEGEDKNAKWLAFTMKWLESDSWRSSSEAETSACKYSTWKYSTETETSPHFRKIWGRFTASNKLCKHERYCISIAIETLSSSRDKFLET